MNTLRAMLRDRRRRQSGSVLSAVLILVAFLSIISGALMTELSTNFLLSNDLVNRVATEATVNSAAELTISQLQSTALNAPCPSPASVTLNKQTAAASYLSCAPVVDVRSPQFVRVASSSAFTADGSYAQLSNLNDFLVGSSGGTIFDYTFGHKAARWTLSLGGSLTGTPLVMQYPGRAGQFLDLIPVSGSACAPANYCVGVWSDGGSSTAPSLQCIAATTAAVVSQPAAGKKSTSEAYFGDTSGELFAIDPTSSGNCEIDDQQAVGSAVVGGPVVFRGNGSDELFVLSSNGSSSQLIPFTYTSTQGLTPAGTQVVSWSGNAPSGIAVENLTLPSSVAISFAGGQVSIVQIDASANASLLGSAFLSTAINGAPYWCHCPGSLNLIGVGGSNGSLYVLNTNLSSYATYSGSSAIQTAPSADAAGDWYFGATDGRLYEVQKTAGSTMFVVRSYGAAGGAIASSPVAAGCPAGICVYLGSTDGSEYLVTLDARNAVLTACLSSAPPACSGTNPRLWAQVEVGVSGNPQTVHVEGWSYYSP